MIKISDFIINGGFEIFSMLHFLVKSNEWVAYLMQCLLGTFNSEQFGIVFIVVWSIFKSYKPEKMAKL